MELRSNTSVIRYTQLVRLSSYYYYVVRDRASVFITIGPLFQFITIIVDRPGAYAWPPSFSQSLNNTFPTIE